MKNLFKIFSVALIVAALFISCADDSVTSSVGGTAFQSINFGKGSAKSLSTAYDGFNQDLYKWWYRTSTTDEDPGIQNTAKGDWTTWSDKAVGYTTPTSETESYGLKGQLPYDYSAGGSMWQLELRAKKLSGTDWVIVYEGKTEFFKVDQNSNNKSVYVPLNYQDIADPGSLAFNHGGIEKLEKFNTTDADLTWTTETYLWKYIDGSVIATDTNCVFNDLWSTYTNLAPDSYIANVKYKSYGAVYEISDTVNVHSNLTATVTGKFAKRLVKDIKVYFHDGKIINADKTERTATNWNYSGKDVVLDEDGNYTHIYTFEDFYSLPSTKTDDNFACVKDGYTFAGWYTTDTSFTDDNRTPETAYLTEGFVRTNTNADGYLKQAIFVEVDGVTTKADLDFVLAYTTMTDVEEENWFYEIHLYARWIPNTIVMGADTKARDNIILDYTSFCNVKDFNASANITINTSQTEIQGFTSYSDVVIYADEDDNFVYVNDNLKENDAAATTATSWAAGKPAVKKYLITGFYDDEGKIVITNDGTLGRKGEALSRFLDPKDDGWIHQSTDPLVSTTITLCAYWREVRL